MNSALFRSIRCFRGLVLLGFLGAIVPAAIAGDDAPKPAQKDSPTRAKPKDVVLTTAVIPAEARPGQTVRFQVTAKLKPGWHIYTQAKAQEGEGPRNTVFDLFDLAGLELAGDWTASKEPQAQAEPAFDNQVFRFFADEVTWSIPLKVPASVSPGKKLIRCQASYQICNAQSCSFPGRWTLPEATLNVLPAGAATAATDGLESQKPARPALAPAVKDSPERIRPRGVTLTPSVSPTEAAPGGLVSYRVTARLGPGLHIYAVGKEQADHPGPVPTTFDFFDPGGLKLSSDWTPDRQPVARPEPAFDNQVVEYFEDEVTWSITLAVPAEAAPGTRTLRCQAGYQICDAKSCYPPGRWTLPEVTLTVVPASAASPVSESPKVADSLPGPAVASVPPSRAGEAREVPSTRSGPASTPATPSAAVAPVPLASQPVSEIARKANEGLVPFLIASAIGGLFALVMPCVWPMVPITVNFFLKQGQAGRGKGKATGLAITYCLAIIAIFTLVGVFFSFFFSASFLQNLANNPWLNLLVAGLFFAFGLSLLGLFEISLPSFLLNASARGESRGGLIGVIFMALTLTITSFTCTFPVVGGLLVMAAGGSFLYPILGLATFASVLAFPFFLLALSPSLLARMPRSGDWMNTVRVVGGLVEIGAAFKFLNTAELGYVTPENAWFDAHVVLTAWIVLSAVCGLYLLGLFRTDHDHGEIQVGPGRMIFGALFLGMALYMAPALFGRPPQSLVWKRLVVGILPPDASEFAVNLVAAGEGSGMVPVKAASSEPAEAERQEKKLHGVLWGMSFEQAKEIAAAEKKPILIDFTGVNCANCRLMEQSVLPRPEIVSRLKQFVTVQLYTDFVDIASLTAAQRRALAERNQELQLDLTQEATNPFYVVLTADGQMVASLGGYNEPAVFLNFLNRALEKARDGLSVAQAPR